jgi:tryptophanyl-tRNA synthetase
MTRKRILSGMRPTGRLHLGHYVGALENWIRLQNEYDSYHMVADWHVLTTDLEHTARIAENGRQVVIDWLAAGLDPVKSPLFVQSRIKEHAELCLLFGMLITVPRLQRNPTVKEQARDLGLDEAMVFGHLGYPVLQAADILIYKADAVPVGEDQVPHVEITREIARRFNGLYGNVFPEPEALLTRFGRLPGLEGKKMSKSLDNGITLSDSAAELEAKLRQAYTDPQKIRVTDPGHPEGCVVMAYHRRFQPGDADAVEADCRGGRLGCVAHKRNMAVTLDAFLAPIRERRARYEADPRLVDDILADGERRAREVARATMAQVREAMRMG